MRQTVEQVERQKTETLAALSKFKEGDRVFNRLTGQHGYYFAPRLNQAMPDCWLLMEEIRDEQLFIQETPTPYDPLDLELCSNASTSLAESEPHQSPQEILEGLKPSSTSNGIASVNPFCEKTSPPSQSTPTLPPLTPPPITPSICSSSRPLAPPLAPQDEEMAASTIETCSPNVCESLTNVNLDSSLSKMFPACCDAPTAQEEKSEVTLNGSQGSYNIEVTQETSAFLAVPNLDCHTSADDCLLLPTPTGLSSLFSRPPGQMKLESHLRKLGLLVRGEVVNPQFLEMMMKVDLDYTSLSKPGKQVLSLSVSRQKTQLKESDVKPLGTLSASPALKKSLNESCTLIALPSENVPVGTSFERELILMDETEAKSAVSRINDACSTIRKLILELEKRKGYIALGFANMSQLMKSNLFTKARSTLQKELQAGRIETDNLNVPVGTFSERQLRSLPKLKSEYHGEAIALAKDIAGDRPLMAKDVSEAVAQLVLERPETRKRSIVDVIKEKTFVPYTKASNYQYGDIVKIKASGNSTLRPLDGYWGIIDRISDFAYHVSIAVEKEIVLCKVDEMARVEASEQDKIVFDSVSKRIKKLAMRDDLEATVWWHLEGLSRQTFFTPMQMDLLEWLEERHGIK